MAQNPPTDPASADTEGSPALPPGCTWVEDARAEHLRDYFALTDVALRHVVHLTEAQVAAAMGVARGTVSATLRAAYAALHAALVIDNEEVNS